jgi:hypothetical protein
VVVAIGGDFALFGARFEAPGAKVGVGRAVAQLVVSQIVTGDSNQLLAGHSGSVIGRHHSSLIVSMQTSQTTCLLPGGSRRIRKIRICAGFSARFPRTFADGHKSIS